MSDADPPIDAKERPALSSLFVELTHDARSFATAEVEYLKAQAGERAHYAVPGLIMIGVAIAFAAGVLIALPIALIWLLAPIIGAGWAVLAIILGGLVLAALLLKLGTRRIKAVLKRPENR